MSSSVRQVQSRNHLLSCLVPLATALVLLGLLFWPECSAAVSVWYDSTAYGHCFLILPIAAYLIWERRENLHDSPLNPAPKFALLCVPLVVLWLIFERLGIMEGRQLAVILIAEALFLTMLGWQTFRIIMGPLLYLIFLVPFGAFTTPLLQSFTAHFIDGGLTLLGIPHFVNAMVIEITAGTFYVAEACAGLRFLIASVAFGVFFALLNYHSIKRRVTFIVASFLIPIIANGFRALGIVVLGHVLGSAEAAAADHLIYGWVFFSAVMLILVAVGLPFREAPGNVVPTQGKAILYPRYPWAAAIVVAISAIAPATARILDDRAEPPSLTGSIGFVPLPGCTVDAANTTTRFSDHRTTTMTCADRNWIITMQGVPARSTASELNEVRRRLIGAASDDEFVTTAPLAGAPGWQAIINREPARITAISSWIDGQISTGGIRQRVLQARHSVFGTDHEALVMAITSKSTHTFSESESRAIVSELDRFLALQPDLEQEILHLTKK